MSVNTVDRRKIPGVLSGMRQLAELTPTLGQQYEIQPVEDGRVILTPKLAAEAHHARLGDRPLTQEEFEAEFGDLSTGPA